MIHDLTKSSKSDAQVVKIILILVTLIHGTIHLFIMCYCKRIYNSILAAVSMLTKA